MTFYEGQLSLIVSLIALTTSEQVPADSLIALTTSEQVLSWCEVRYGENKAIIVLE